MIVGIIGTGWVGSSVAISLLHSGVVTELLLHDIRREVAEGDAMDLAHGAPFYPAASVRTATPQEMKEADAIVVAAGRGGEPGESRLELLKENAEIIWKLGEELAGCRGVIVVVSNPVDVLTHVMTRASGLPPARVLGTGTMLDTARLRQILGERLHLDPRSIHAHVVGEHGDSSVILWSSARVGATSLAAWPGWRSEWQEDIAANVRSAAYEIIRRKGATNHAIGLVTAALLRWMLRGERRVLNISRVHEGMAGGQDVALSLPTVVGARGGTRVVEPELDEDERRALEKSASILAGAMDSLDLGG